LKQQRTSTKINEKYEIPGKQDTRKRRNEASMMAAQLASDEHDHDCDDTDANDGNVQQHEEARTQDNEKTRTR